MGLIDERGAAVLRSFTAAASVGVVTLALATCAMGASAAAAALSRSLDDHWGVVGEVSGTSQHGADSTRQLRGGTSYNVSRQLVLDAGAARSLRSGTPVWSAFTGLTWLAARIF